MKFPPSFFRSSDWICGILLLAATFLAYNPAWNGQPVWDDDAHITKPELWSAAGFPNIFHQWVKQNPQSIEAKYYAGLVMKTYGYYDEALEMLRQVVRKNPSIDAAITEINIIENTKMIYGMD
jgi:hypothetical protein